MKITTPLSVLPLLLGWVRGLHNGLARTPPMGWNNWNSLGCAVSENLLLDVSKKIVDSGLRDVGYKYVVLDDCWQAVPGRGIDGRLIADPEKFPHGMAWQAERLHENGLLYGMYSSAGHLTCARYEASLDHEKVDAETFASWGVDYLKYDNCFNLGRFGLPEISFRRFNAMATALNETGRPMVYSLCSWGEDSVHMWAASIANSWRVSGDIYDEFTRPDALCSCVDPSDPHCIAPGTHCSVLNIINRVAPYVDKGYPGAWNDLDMLEVGNGGMSDDEYVAHFSMWAALKSTLLIGADLRILEARDLSIINNPAVIAVSQDPLGMSARRISRSVDVPKDRYGEGEIQVWSGPLYPRDLVVVLLNAADAEVEISVTLSELFIGEPHPIRKQLIGMEWAVHDLWADRMSEERAKKVLGGAKNAGPSPELKGWYNATELPYVDGLEAGDGRLLGMKVGKVLGTGELKERVPRHAVKMYRLRPSESVERYSMHRDEL